MSDNFGAELDRLLDQYDEKRRAVSARKEQVKADEAAFLAEFAELRRSVIRPVFEAVGAALRARGHASTIVEEDYVVQPGGKATEAKISILVAAAGAEGASPRPDQSPSLAFVTRHYNRAVEIHGGNVSSQSAPSAGSRGEYQLRQITTELVREKLLALIADIARS